MQKRWLYVGCGFFLGLASGILLCLCRPYDQEDMELADDGDGDGLAEEPERVYHTL